MYVISQGWLLLTAVMTFMVGLSKTYNGEEYNVNYFTQFYQTEDHSLMNRRVQHYGGYGGPYIVIYPSEQDPIFVHDTQRPAIRPSRKRSKTRSKTPVFPVTTRPIREWLSSLASRRVTVTKTAVVTQIVTTTKIMATRCIGTKVVLKTSNPV